MRTRWRVTREEMTEGLQRVIERVRAAQPDPYYEGHEGFELVLDLLEDACEGLLNDLKNPTRS